jgi:hypothetical protein
MRQVIAVMADCGMFAQPSRPMTVMTVSHSTMITIAEPKIADTNTLAQFAPAARCSKTRKTHETTTDARRA